MTSSVDANFSPRKAVVLLVIINLFNYIDRYILSAVEPEIRAALFAPDDPAAMAKTGSLATAFLLSYMVFAPLFGWIADRTSRWLLIAGSVALWSLASGASGLAATFGFLLFTRILVGIGEAGYGPSAPTIIADLFPLERRGRVLSFFYLAIPVGSAIGFAFGSAVEQSTGSWRIPFYLVTIPGLILALLCLFMRDPRQMRPAASDAKKTPRPAMADYLRLLKTPSYALNTLAMAAMTFAIGGLSFWVPEYLRFRGQPESGRIFFGGITVVAGIVATLSGGWAGDALRKRVRGAYFIVSGTAILLAFPCTVAMIYSPFPLAWMWMSLAIFFLFFNTGPANTALANVSPQGIRSTAFALNIFIIHALGDAVSPPLIGWIAGRWDMNIAFLVVSATMAVAGVIWLIAAQFLDRDTARAQDVPQA